MKLKYKTTFSVLIPLSAICLIILSYFLIRQNTGRINRPPAVTMIDSSQGGASRYNKFQLEEAIQKATNATKVYIYSSPVASDINHDGIEEVIAAAVIIGGQISDTSKAIPTPNASDDLFVLRRINNELTILTTYPNIFTDSPYIYTTDLIGDSNQDIILSGTDLSDNKSESTIQILTWNDNKLQPTQFTGGEYDNVSIFSGYIEKKSLIKDRLSIKYGPKNSVEDDYQWNGETFEFQTSTAVSPSQNHALIIQYLNKNLSRLIKTKPTLGAPKFFPEYIQIYPQGYILTSLSDGHINVYMFASYKIMGKVVTVKNIKEGDLNTDDVQTLRTENKLTSESIGTYFRSSLLNNIWKMSPVDIFND